MNSNRQIINEFLTKLTTSLSPNKVLLLNFTKPKILDINIDNALEITSEEDFGKFTNGNFDAIIGDLPFGMQPVIIDTVSKLKVNRNWSYLLFSLQILQATGKAFFLIEPSILSSRVGKRFLQYLSEQEYYVTSVFELPEKILYPETAFQPIVIGFEKKPSNNLFIGEITSDYNILIDNYIKRNNGENLSNGLIIDRQGFDSFNRFKIESEILSLKTQYKDYEKYILRDISHEINLTKKVFQEKPNSVYIPRIGKSEVVSDIKKTTLKHQNYFQVVLDESQVNAEFLALFYRSEIGRLILKSLSSGSFIPNINKSDIETSYVTVPKLAEQNLLALANQKLSELQENINELRTELSLNPKNAGVVLDKFEGIQRPLKQLSEEDRIYSLIRKGENKHIEFKETFSKNIRTGLKDKEIEKSSLKNIVGFLNADGGTLLIGVSDEGIIKGVEEDFFQVKDKYKLNFKNALKTKIGSEFYPLIDYDLFSVGGKLILMVMCKPSSEPCFFDDSEFYVRTNPATDKLVGKKQVEYIKRRFSH